MTEAKQLSRRNNFFVALAIFLFVFLALFFTDKDISITWDEPAYMLAGESYAEWFQTLVDDPDYALSEAGIERYWEANHEHPPFDKIWSGLVWLGVRSFLPDLTAHRMGNIILNSLLFAMLYLLVQDVYGWWVGVLSSVFLFSMPRVFFHAHLSALDLAAATMIVMVVLLFWKTRQNSSWWIDIALAVVWGLAVATKVNAVFVYFVFVIWSLPYKYEEWMGRRLLVMGVLAIPVFILSWPWLYHYTFERIWEYVLFITVDHWEIGQWYFNQFYMPPPWHFPFVITAVVVPLTLFILFFVGLARVLMRKEERPFGWYLILNGFVPMLALAIGQSMVYDNDRLFIAAMPFIAALAAIGFYALVQLLGRRLTGRTQLAAAVGLLLIVLLPQIWSVRSIYPHLLSYYSEGIGGVAGAEAMGLEVTYWCETYNEALDYLNEHAEPGDVVFIAPWSHDVMVYYQLQGLLRDDIYFTAPFPTTSIFDQTIRMQIVPYDKADFVVFQNRGTTFGSPELGQPYADWLAAREADYEWVGGGVPLISVYEREN
jgi:4-amino-4-deoxy-L-arabinose transferase-like glycosyltransferase